MNTAFVLAQFIGEDGSLGYTKGKVYPLIISKLGWFSRVMRGVTLEIVGVDGKGYCPYESEWSFYKNWSVVPEGKYMVKIEKLKGVKQNG